MNNNTHNENITAENKHNNTVMRLILIFVAATILITISVIIFFTIKKDAQRSGSVHFSNVTQEYIDYITNPQNNLNDLEDLDNVDDVIYSESDEESFVSIKTSDIPSSNKKNVNSEFFRKNLSDNEKVVYDSILYAYSVGYNYIGFSTKTFTPEMLSKASFYVLCDNPFIEINLERTILTRNNFVYLFFPNMNEEKKEQNELAYEKALSIVESIPKEFETEYEVAKYLYEYLVCNTAFTTDENYNSNTVCALYDALCGGTTNCDGFSNALTMLFNMAEIECFSVFYAGDATSAGHAWCVAEIDGSYYHLDPSNDAAVYQVIQSTDVFSFLCASDKVKLANSYYDDSIKDLVPACTDERYDYQNVDVNIDATDVQDALDSAVEYVDGLGLQEDMTDKEFFLINFALLNGMESGVRDSFINGFLQKLSDKYVVEGHAYIGAGTVFVLLTV